MAERVMTKERWNKVSLSLAKHLRDIQEIAEFYGITNLHISIPGDNLMFSKPEAYYITDRLGRVDVKSVEAWEDGRVRIKYDGEIIYDRVQRKEER